MVKTLNLRYIYTPFVNYLSKADVMLSFITFSSTEGLLPKPILTSFEPVTGIPLNKRINTLPFGVRSK